MTKNAASVGGKAETLLRLIRQFPVPPFFVVTPDQTDDSILQRFDELGADEVAVRSSAHNEDGVEASWAGQFDTYLHVSRADLLRAVKNCQQSITSDRVRAYSDARQQDSGGIAVIVQVMISAQVSGVAFSYHPVTKEHAVVIEAVQGLGDALVGGTTTPDTYVEDGELQLSGDQPVLSLDEQKEVARYTREVEKYLGYPVDIEWAYESGKFYLLQARPITTL